MFLSVCQDVHARMSALSARAGLEPDDFVFLHEQGAGAAFSVQSNFKVITPDHAKMNIAFVGNTGHFGNEPDLGGSESLDGKKDVNVKPQKTFFVFPFGHGMIVACFCSTRTELDEEVATLQLPALGALLTVFAEEHADSIVFMVEGPFKGEHCKSAVESVVAGGPTLEKSDLKEAQGTTAKTTPPYCQAQKPRGGHPSCGGTAGHLPSGQWYPATGHWRTERKGGDPNTDQVTKGGDS